MTAGVLWVLVAACGARSVQVDDADGDADADADGDTDSDCGPAGESWVEIERVDDAADILFLVDNSNSMREEQTNLTANFPTLLDSLTTPPDEDGDGSPDWQPVKSLHIGVISSDMGTSGYPVTTCDDAEHGDDGVLQHIPSATVIGCNPTYPSFLTWDAGDPDTGVAHAFECIATLGTGGCGFVQPLGAVEKAVTVHAAYGGANYGFYRPGAVLVVYILSDGDDCTVFDPTIFGDDDTLGPLSLRCFNNPEMVTTVDDLVLGLLAVKPGRPDRLMVAAIVGVPNDLVLLSDDAIASGDPQSMEDFDRILNDYRMNETIDFSPEGGGTRLVPSCDVPGLGIASPPRRIVETIELLDAEGASGVVQSICQSDWSDASSAIAHRLDRTRGGGCLPNPVVEDGRPLATGEHADCVVRTLSDLRDCDAQQFRVGEEGGRALCQLCQAGDGAWPYERDFRGDDISVCAGATSRWYYDAEDPTCGSAGKIRFQDEAQPTDGAMLRLECASPAMPPAPGC